MVNNEEKRIKIIKKDDKVEFIIMVSKLFTN